MARTQWTIEMIEIIKTCYADTQTQALADQLGISTSAIYQKAAALCLKKSAEYLSGPHACRLRRGDNVGKDTRFHQGQAPWNKGMKGLDIGGKETRFCPGVLPHNTREIGSYRFSKEGYLQRKIANAKGSNSKRWRSVHELVWIEHNGPVPEKHIVVFKPTMRTNVLEQITIKKLECISMAENMRRNTLHRYGKEIASTIQLRGAITRQINRRKAA